MVITSVGGRPDKSLVRAGEAHGDVAWVRSPRYIAAIRWPSLVVRIGALANILRDLVFARISVGGVMRIWAQGWSALIAESDRCDCG